MEDTFDLVMVAERWDESMVLLRDSEGYWELLSSPIVGRILRDSEGF